MDKKVGAKKHLGQNFLIDKNIIQKIISTANIEGKEVIEIGPGQGAITEILVEKAQNVIAYEIDQDMINILKNKIDASNFILRHEDFLKAEFDWKNKKYVVANLPYYITSKILFKMFDSFDKFEKIIVMVQKEVAERMVAKVNTSDYGKLSISCQFLANIKKEFDIPPSSFWPMPKVTSSIVTMEFFPAFDVNIKEFLEFIKTCFSMKRKTLFNNLKQNLAIDQINEIYSHFNLNNNVRPQQITKEIYYEIFKFINKDKNEN